MSPAQRSPLWTAWLWLLLATIAAHATLPVGSPLVRTAGSAFSVTTSDVALTPKRKDARGEAALEQDRSDRGASSSGSGSDLSFLPQRGPAFAASLPQPSGYFPPAGPVAKQAAWRAFDARGPPAA